MIQSYPEERGHLPEEAGWKEARTKTKRKDALQMGLNWPENLSIISLMCFLMGRLQFFYGTELAR